VSGNYETCTPQAPIDRRFLRKLQKIDTLFSLDKRLLLGTVDAFLARVS